MEKFSKCARILIVIVNIVFLVIGLVLFAGGLFVRFGSSVLNDLFSVVIEQLEATLKSSGYGDIDLSATFNITDILFGVAIGLICFGLFLAIITLFGCCGGCYKIRGCLIIYLVICLVVLVGEIVIVIIFFRYPEVFDNPSKQLLKKGIQSDYQGLNGTNLVSLGWNFVTQQMACCGVDDYDDFTGAKGWVTDYTNYKLKTPLACCRTLPDSFDFTCADMITATDSNNYMNTGCYQKIKDIIFGNVFIMAGSLSGIGIIQILLIIFTVILCTSERRNKVTPRSSAKDDGMRQPQQTATNECASKPRKKNASRRF